MIRWAHRRVMQAVRHFRERGSDLVQCLGIVFTFTLNCNLLVKVLLVRDSHQPKRVWLAVQPVVIMDGNRQPFLSKVIGARPNGCVVSNDLIVG